MTLEEALAIPADLRRSQIVMFGYDESFLWFNERGNLIKIELPGKCIEVPEGYVLVKTSPNKGE